MGLPAVAAGVGGPPPALVGLLLAINSVKDGIVSSVVEVVQRNCGLSETSS